MRNLTERDFDTLNEMSGGDWLRPMDVGGRNGSHHSATLTKLWARGLVERQQRSARMTRGSWEYRITQAGIERLKKQ